MTVDGTPTGRAAAYERTNREFWDDDADDPDAPISDRLHSSYFGARLFDWGDGTIDFHIPHSGGRPKRSGRSAKARGRADRQIDRAHAVSACPWPERPVNEVNRSGKPVVSAGRT